MFKTIEPKHHCFYKPLIEHFIKSCPSLGFEFSNPLQNRTTFILKEDQKRGVYGGAMLFKRKLSDFPKELVKPLSNFISLKEPIWEAVVSISFEDDSPLYTSREVEQFCQTFYRSLYETLVKFGKKERTGFLYVSLDSGEYHCVEGLTLWPYVFELKPQDSSDGLFHGILPLIGSQYESYKQAWQALDFAFQERRLAL